LPLGRLRARGQLTEIRAADLRFDETEAATFLRGGMGLALSEGDLARLAMLLFAPAGRLNWPEAWAQ
jgi:LuxR family maltose regulon positive regulatory protein